MAFTTRPCTGFWLQVGAYVAHAGLMVFWALAVTLFEASHLGAMLGTASIAWAGHLVHVALPVSRGAHVDGLASFTQLCHPLSLASLLGLFWMYNSISVVIFHFFHSSRLIPYKALLGFRFP